MRLATIRTSNGTRAVRHDGDALVDLGHTDVGMLLQRADWRAIAQDGSGAKIPADGADYAPIVSNPSKVICVGQNYRNHIEEMGRELPSFPTLFPKFSDTLIGAHDDIVKPSESEAVDWEAELVVVMGKTIRRATEEEAQEAIAGFTVMNDISMRDWQFRTGEWTQGKIWDRSTPVGPHLVTPDELGGTRPSLKIRTTVDGEVMQDDDTGTLLFDPVALVCYISTIITLRPGDLIATGTAAGVGHARDPKVYLTPGQTVTTEIDGIGSCVNRIVAAE